MITLSPLANFGSAVPWGLWVSIYIWLVGISAGNFSMIMWGQLKDKPHIKKLTRIGMVLSLSCLLAGLLSILADLGHIERSYKLFISPNFTSIMAWMVWMYNVYAAVLLGSLLFLKKDFPKIFSKIGFLFGITLLLLEGLLFAMPPGKLWHSPIFVIHFLTSSLASGILALIVVVSFFWEKDGKEEFIKQLGNSAVVFILGNLLIEIIEMIAHGNVTHTANWLLIGGGIIVIALLLKRASSTITLAAIIGLINILLSKYYSVVSAQIVEPFKNFSHTYIEPRIQFSYAPSAFEFLVAIFLVCAAGVLFYFLYRIFPLTREEKI